MSRIRIAALGLAASALVGVASGCGGTTKTSTTTASSTQAQSTTATQSSTPAKAPGTAKSLSRAELISAADTICYGINVKRAAVRISTPQQYLLLVPPFAAYEQAAVEELSKLTPPASMTIGWNELVSAAKANAAATMKVVEILKRHEPLDGTKSKQIAITLNKSAQDLTTIATREGLTDCAETS